MFKKCYFLLMLFSTTSFSMIIDNLDDIRADWRSISDQVMGGISEVNFNLLKENEKKFYRLEGNVSTKNNGGFIQSVVRIQDDLSRYNGVRLTVRGTEDEYFIWIRTPACRFPWDRYIVSFKPDQNWTSIEIPFNDFKKSNFYIRNKMNTGNIETLAIAAYGKDFSAQVDIAHLEFY